MLLKTLEEQVDELDELGERLHGGRFLSAFHIEDEWESYDRTRFSEGEWKELCEEHGVDPTREEFVLPLEPYVEPLGAKVTPSSGLTQLIAVYALRNRSLDPLLDALHRDPSEVDRARLKKDIEELRHYAGRIARRVRGEIVSSKGGRPDQEVPRYELLVKWSYIDPLREKGYSDEAILDELNTRRYKKEDGKAYLFGRRTKARGAEAASAVLEPGNLTHQF